MEKHDRCNCHCHTHDVTSLTVDGINYQAIFHDRWWETKKFRWDDDEKAWLMETFNLNFIPQGGLRASKGFYRLDRKSYDKCEARLPDECSIAEHCHIWIDYYIICLKKELLMANEILNNVEFRFDGSVWTVHHEEKVKTVEDLLRRL